MRSSHDSTYPPSSPARTSTKRVLIEADEHPELARLIELPSEAPDSWLAEAFLLATGRSPRLDTDEYDRIRILDRNPWAHSYVWSRPVEEEFVGSYDDDWLGGDGLGAPAGAFALPGIPLVLRASIVGHSSQPASAQLVTAETAAEPVPMTPLDWRQDPVPFCAEEVNRELGARFGVGKQKFDVTSVAGSVRHSWGHSDLTSLMSSLPPERRLALRRHLSGAKLLEPVELDDHDLRELTAGFRWLIEHLGPDGREQAADGWLGQDTAADAERALRWPEGSGALLLSAARQLHVIRRSKGRVVPLAAVRSWVAEPRRAMKALIDWVGGGGSAMTGALIALADGSAAGEADLLAAAQDVAAMTRDVRDEYLSEYGDYWDEALSPRVDVSSPDAGVRGLVEKFALLGGEGHYGELTPAARKLAQRAIQ